jgi:hypothetical protein
MDKTINENLLSRLEHSRHERPDHDRHGEPDQSNIPRAEVLTYQKCDYCDIAKQRQSSENV